MKRISTPPCKRDNHFIEHKSHPYYKRWLNMSEKCYRKANAKYEYYGARGIQVCERWRGTDEICGFCAFVKDMGDKPDPKYTLDRINNDGDYAPDNCRWADYSTQNHNQRLKRNNKTGYRGVHRKIRKDGLTVWTVTLDVRGEHNYFGTFMTFTEALHVRQIAEKQLI